MAAMFRQPVTLRSFTSAAGAALLTLTAGTAALALAATGWAAVPVEESRDARQTPAGVPDPAPGGGSDTSRLAELFYEMQILRQEVQELRGRLEEQGHRLDRLARDQQEQYLDLDRRMQALRGGGSASSTPQESPAGAESPAAAPDSGGSGSFASSGTPGTEREAYTAAFELMKQRQFDASTEAFNRLIVEYPNGAYTPNAFYWLGELYLAQENNEQARQSFAQVVNLYPDHQKVPDALYKLGVVYHRLGDVQRAREYLSQVRREHPQSSAAGLAETYLAEL